MTRKRTRESKWPHKFIYSNSGNSGEFDEFDDICCEWEEGSNLLQLVFRRLPAATVTRKIVHLKHTWYRTTSRCVICNIRHRFIGRWKKRIVHLWSTIEGGHASHDSWVIDSYALKSVNHEHPHWNIPMRYKWDNSRYENADLSYIWKDQQPY